MPDEKRNQQGHYRAGHVGQLPQVKIYKDQWQIKQNEQYCDCFTGPLGNRSMRFDEFMNPKVEIELA